MREKFARFMAGRNGNDQFNLFILIVDIVLLLLAGMFAGSLGKVLYPLVILLLVLPQLELLLQLHLPHRRSLRSD